MKLDESETYEWWIAKSPVKSSWLEKSITFGEKHPITILDQFGGKQPYLMNRQFVTDRQLSVPNCARAVVDSNLMDGIVDFMSDRRVNDGMLGFIKFISERGWDISADFFLAEQFAKSTNSDFMLHATRRMGFFYRFLSLDVSYFLETSEIRLNPDAVTHFLREGNAETLDEVAERHVQSFAARNTRRQSLEAVEATEIALLQMVLLREFEMRGASAATQYLAFQDFMSRTVQVSLAREGQLALHYFCGFAGRLLGVKPNTPWKTASKNISATAWDLLLLRMPELMLKPPKAGDHLQIGYVATHEKDLKKLARLMSLHTVLSGEKPVVQFDMSAIPQATIDMIRNELGGEMNPRIVRAGPPIVPVGIRDALARTLAALLPT